MYMNNEHIRIKMINNDHIELSSFKIERNWDPRFLRHESGS